MSDNDWDWIMRCVPGMEPGERVLTPAEYKEEILKVMLDDEEEEVLKRGLSGDDLALFVANNRFAAIEYTLRLFRRYDEMFSKGEYLTTRSIRELRQSQKVPEAPYSHVYQEKVTNVLTKTSSQKMERRHGTSSAPTQGGMEVYSGYIYIDDVKVYLSNFDNLSISPTTQRVKDYILGMLSKKLSWGKPMEEQPGGFNKIVLNAKDFMKACGLRDLKSACEQLNRAFNELYNVAFEWYGREGYSKRNRSNRKLFHSRFLGSYAEPVPVLEKGKEQPIHFVDGEFVGWVDPILCEVLAHATIAPFPERLYKVNMKLNPLSYCIGSWLVRYKNMNLGTPQESVISLEALRNALGELLTLDEVRESGKSEPSKLIRKPLERDLKALRRVSCDGGVYRVLEWCYQDETGCLVTDWEASKMSFKEWAKLSVKFSFIDYPDQSQYIEKKQKRIESLEKAKEARLAKSREKAAGPASGVKRPRGRPRKAGE